MKIVISALCSVFIFASISATAQGDKWEAVTGAETLRNFISGLQAERTLPNGEISRGEFSADGTGTLSSWGATLPRTWSIKGVDQICITERRITLCYTLERSMADPELYRVQDLETGRLTEFRVTDGRGTMITETKPVGNEGSPATPSADELAAELSNPNSSVASLNFKNQFRWFDGELPGAGDQSSYTLLFQPILPFVLDSGDKVIWRPAVPMLVGQPQIDAGSGEFKERSGLGDIAFDLAFVPKRDDSLLIAYGLITSLPTATNDLGSDRWTLGPEFLLGKISPKYVVGLFPNHQWDIAGSGDADINLTTITAFYTYLPGDGWSVGTAPIMNYDWNSDQWTIPLQLNAGKTVMWNGRPWKLNAELNYYVEKADAFGADWMLGINIAPVVKNGMAKWFGLGD